MKNMNKFLQLLLLLTIMNIYNAYADTAAINPVMPDYLLPVRMDRMSYGFYNPLIEYKGNIIRYNIIGNDAIKISFHGKQYTFQISKLIEKATNAWQNASILSGSSLLKFAPAKSSHDVNMQFIVMNKVIDGLNPEITAINVQPNHPAKYGASVLGVTPYARIYLFTDNLKYADDFSYHYLHDLVFQSQVSDQEIVEFLLLFTLEHTIGHTLGLQHAPYDVIESVQNTKNIMFTGNNIDRPSIPIMINNDPNIAAAVVYMTKLAAHLGRKLVLDDLQIAPQEAVALRCSIANKRNCS
jgi:hypothetical protein